METKSFVYQSNGHFVTERLQPQGSTSPSRDQQQQQQSPSCNSNRPRSSSTTSTSGPCDSQDVTSDETLLQQQLGEFWSYAVDLPNRGGFNNPNHQYHHHHHLLPHDANLFDDNDLEKQFLYQDFLTRPVEQAQLQRKKTTSTSTSNLLEPKRCVLRGEDIKDVPTTYVISGLEKNEIPVIGTYVDRRILPGFRYRVRMNQSPKFLFDGQAMFLQSISIGYGKRLTFESDNLNNNQNYFWSDSRPEGYGFSLVALNAGDRLLPVTCELDNDAQNTLEISRVLSQRELTTCNHGNGDVIKTVHVEFVCRSISGLTNDFRVAGVAFLVKVKGSRRCRLEKIETECGAISQKSTVVLRKI